MTTEQATAVAERNAAKMTGQGYTMRAGRTEGFYFVTKPDGEKNYLVVAFSGRCECPFNKENGVCKHGVWVADELACAASVEARDVEAPIDAIA